MDFADAYFSALYVFNTLKQKKTRVKGNIAPKIQGKGEADFFTKQKSDFQQVVHKVITGLEVHLLADAVAGIFNCAGGAVEHLGDLLGGHLQAKQGAKPDFGWREGWVALRKPADEAFVKLIEAGFKFFPQQFAIVFGL